MASIRTAPGGPGIVTRQAPLKKSYGEYLRVYVQRMAPGPEQGKWQPISRDGFEVVCPSKLEASNLVFLVGGRFFPRPAELIHDDDRDDIRYLDWLLAHWFRIENCRGEVGPFDENGVCHRRRQVEFWSWIRGWTAGVEDILRCNTLASETIGPALQWRWDGR